MPKHGADDGPPAPGQGRAADHHHGDHLELVAGAAVGVGRQGADRADDPGQGRHHRREDEEPHLGPGDVDAAGDGGLRVAARGLIQLPTRLWVKT
jgi:hypothetical protein